jgi:hypothetical protein
MSKFFIDVQIKNSPCGIASAIWFERYCLPKINDGSNTYVGNRIHQCEDFLRNHIGEDLPDGGIVFSGDSRASAGISQLLDRMYPD